MKSNTAKTTHKKPGQSAKSMIVNSSMLAIGKKLQEIKASAGSADMSEWNLSLFKHLR